MKATEEMKMKSMQRLEYVLIAPSSSPFVCHHVVREV